MARIAGREEPGPVSRILAGAAMTKEPDRSAHPDAGKVRPREDFTEYKLL
jgi:hypothetical protein